MDSGSFVDRSEAERTTLAEALKRYRKEIVPEKRHPYQEERRIDRWLDNDLTHRTLANLRGTDFAKYRDERRAAGRAENTIRLELQLIRHLFEIARKEWGMEGLPNPLDNIRKPSGSKARERRLRPGEFEKLKALLSVNRNPWVAPAFELAIETSLRQGTLFGLQWEWVDLNNRVARIPAEARGADNKGVPPLSLCPRAVHCAPQSRRNIGGRGSAPRALHVRSAKHSPRSERSGVRDQRERCHMCLETQPS
ncbi:Shufflon-specific DNA recombinase [Candidatus Burkholderia humilis]|nr:Shufflon-specific DNA recombinase [Candidatus Burkholderia humilis]